MELETTCKRGPGQNPSSRETPPPSPVFPRISAPNGKFQQTSQPAVRRWRCCIPASQLTPQPIVLSCCSQCQSENFLLMFVMNKIPGLTVKKSHHLLHISENMKLVV